MRGYLLALTIMLTTLVAATSAKAGDIPTIKDLRHEASQSREMGLPILLMFSADHCTYCVRIEEDFLKPMQSGGFYDDKVIIRRIKLGSQQVADLDGSRITTRELGERYDVSVTPTLVFIDHKGRQLAPKLVGLTTPELYGGYLDEAIDTSLDRLRRTKPLAVKVSSN